LEGYSHLPYHSMFPEASEEKRKDSAAPLSNVKGHSEYDKVVEKMKTSKETVMDS
jgi:hypothetical protein